MQTSCCRKCSKLMCENRNKIENCEECISYVLLAMREIDEKLKIEYKEEENC